MVPKCDTNRIPAEPQAVRITAHRVTLLRFSLIAIHPMLHDGMMYLSQKLSDVFVKTNVIMIEIDSLFPVLLINEKILDTNLMENQGN